jgi:hypothetical protein
MQTSAPAARNLSAIRLPIPLAPPVTTATLPLKSNIFQSVLSRIQNIANIIIPRFFKYQAAFYLIWLQTA